MADIEKNEKIQIDWEIHLILPILKASYAL